jgi:hypothetical protein
MEWRLINLTLRQYYLYITYKIVTVRNAVAVYGDNTSNSKGIVLCITQVS